MNESEKEALAKFLNLLTETMTQSKDFVLEQAPLVVQEMVTLGRVQFGIGFVGCALAVLACAWLGWKHRSAFEELEPSPLIFVVMFGTPMALMGMATCGYMFIRVYFAPRLYVIEQIAGMLK